MGVLKTALAEWRSLDDWAARDTPLTRLDPRAKLLTTAVFVLVVVSFERHAVAALLPLAVFPVALAVLGDLPAGPIVRRLALASPFAVMVGLFNPWLDRAPVLLAGDISLAAGWFSFASILLRFALTVAAALLLVAGTGMFALCAALARLGVPRVLTLQLLFLYRYAFVVGDEAARMTTARQLRSSGRPATLRSQGPLLGHLLLRAVDRARRSHQAMQARGFNGELRVMRTLRWRGRDTAFVLGWVGVFFALRAFNLPQWLGRTLLGGLA